MMVLFSCCLRVLAYFFFPFLICFFIFFAPSASSYSKFFVFLRFLFALLELFRWIR